MEGELREGTKFKLDGERKHSLVKLAKANHSTPDGFEPAICKEEPVWDVFGNTRYPYAYRHYIMAQP